MEGCTQILAHYKLMIESNIKYLFLLIGLNIITCRMVHMTKLTYSSSDDWIY
jgi:hypothetical protein